ncbi:MAG: WG repeat-containing protein [Hyphomonadaceae bacterium]
MEKPKINPDEAIADFKILENSTDEKFLIAEDANGLQLHLNEDGQPLYEHRFDQVGRFVGDLAPVWLHDSAHGGRNSENVAFHITKTGEPAYSERYDSVSTYSEDRARVTKDSVYFYINTEGLRVGTQSYLDAEDYDGGIARATLPDGMEIQIDLEGNQVS